MGLVYQPEWVVHATCGPVPQWSAVARLSTWAFGIMGSAPTSNWFGVSSVDAFVPPLALDLRLPIVAGSVGIEARVIGLLRLSPLRRLPRASVRSDQVKPQGGASIASPSPSHFGMKVLPQYKAELPPHLVGSEATLTERCNIPLQLQDSRVEQASPGPLTGMALLPRRVPCGHESALKQTLRWHRRSAPLRECRLPGQSTARQGLLHLELVTGCGVTSWRRLLRIDQPQLCARGRRGTARSLHFSRGSAWPSSRLRFAVPVGRAGKHLWLGAWPARARHL